MTRKHQVAYGVREPWWVKSALVLLVVAFLAAILLLPMAVVAFQAVQQGLPAMREVLDDPDNRQAILLTLLTAAVCVPLNIVFGICAAWAVTKHSFRGKSVLMTLIDLPFSVSPVVAGLMLVLLFGTNGVFGRWLQDHDIKIIFAVPGIILATSFVTLPFVARELIPVMEDQGKGDEEAALMLGASGLYTFMRVTLPNVRWGLFYGVILCNARAMGEFGAVSVVSGHIAGMTNTMPLQIELLYNDYNFVGSFTLACMLAGLALVTLVLKGLVEWFQDRESRRSRIPRFRRSLLVDPSPPRQAP